MADQENISADFVFGTLATDDLRLAQLRAAQLGVAHDTLSPLDPQPGEAVTVHVTLGPAISADHVTCYYTTDGSLPDGARGVACEWYGGDPVPGWRCLGYAAVGLPRAVGRRASRPGQWRAGALPN